MTQIDQHHPHDDPPPAPPPRGVEAEGTSPLRLAMVVLGIVLLGLWTSLSAVVVVLAIVVMIFLHELGHFITAKAAGMKCTEFFIGFGPRIWSFHRGETEYGIKAIPAGAYVKVIGMTNLEEVDPADEDRTYRQKSYWRRMSVAVAGSAMHFALALLCLFVLLVGFGMSDDDHWHVGRLAAADGTDASPAAEAGVEVGDEIVSIGVTPIATFDDVRDALEGREPGESVPVTVERGGVETQLSVALGDNGSGGAFLGIGPRHPRQTVAPLSAVPRAFTEFGSVSWQSMQALADFFSPSGLGGFVSMAVDSADEPTADESTVSSGSSADENRVLSIYGAARLGTQAADEGVAPLVAFLALINIFIGIFNLVPLLPLDGGHVAVATYERIRELAARTQGRYHADVAKLMPLTYVVVFVLVGVGLIALYLDIADPVNLN
ncbi:MAG: RIP metalloprotease [Acidimicrobiia bacterium]|nr:RIP metalloprotease [Acidimicrobiia bacterium]